jgi:hypothetical protein
MTITERRAVAEAFESEYLRFYEVQVKVGRKTRAWLVTSTSGNKLGVVSFYGAWRQYVFYPEPDTIFNKGCMNDLARFCDEQTSAWREGLRSRG